MNRKTLHIAAAVMWPVVASYAQIKSGSTVDFSGAGATLPVKAGSGASAPATCTANKELYIKTDAPAGQQLYLCNTAGSGWNLVGDGGSGGGGAVASVFGRTGTVAAQTGDYGFWQISGTASDSQIAAGVSAQKIGSGLVSNTVFGYLANVTSDIQAQLNGKAATQHAHTAVGDVSGDLGSTSVVALRNRPLSTTPPANGQALVWNGATYRWEPQSVAGTGGIKTAAQLGDLAAAKTDASVLSIGQYCTTASPCNVRIGSNTYSFVGGATVTLTSGSGTAYIYIDSAGILTVGHNVTLSCSGCVAQSGVAGFPLRSIPLFTWTATGGIWDDTGGNDRRAFLGSNVVLGGTGIALVESGNRTVVSVDTATVPSYLTGSATLNFTAFATGSCSADMTIAVPGAQTGDAVSEGWPAGLEAGITGTMRVSAPGVVAVRLCNLSGAAVDPASASFRATIVRSF